MLKNEEDDRECNDYYGWKYQDELKETLDSYEDYYDWKHRNDDT